jgi:hypothetical protein
LVLVSSAGDYIEDWTTCHCLFERPILCVRLCVVRISRAHEEFGNQTLINILLRRKFESRFFGKMPISCRRKEDRPFKLLSTVLWLQIKCAAEPLFEGQVFTFDIILRRKPLSEADLSGITFSRFHTIFLDLKTLLKYYKYVFLLSTGQQKP